MAFFFSFRSILKGGETEDKEAPDEAFIGKVSQRSPSVVQSCGASSAAGAEGWLTCYRRCWELSQVLVAYVAQICDVVLQLFTSC